MKKTCHTRDSPLSHCMTRHSGKMALNVPGIVVKVKMLSVHIRTPTANEQQVCPKQPGLLVELVLVIEHYVR